MAQGDITIASTDIVGTQVVITGTIAVGAAYSAGGIAPSPAKFGLVDVLFVNFETVELAATTALIARYDAATDKVMLHEGDAGTAGPLAQTDEALTNATPIKFQAWGRVSGNLAAT